MSNEISKFIVAALVLIVQKDSVLLVQQNIGEWGIVVTFLFLLCQKICDPIITNAYWIFGAMLRQSRTAYNKHAQR